MSKKKRIPTPQEVAAGEQNLANWLQDHPSRGRLTHGSHSVHIRKRYDDLRTSEGKQLALIMRDLEADLGGPAALTSPQRLLLANLRATLIPILQISRYAANQDSIITATGELLPCLRYGFTTFLESSRRIIEALYALKRKPVHTPYDKIIKALENGE